MSDRLRAAFLGRLERTPPGADCAAPARIWAAVRGEVDPAEARGLVDHALDCASCALAWRVAREVATEAAPARVARRRFRRAHWAAVAAAILVVLLIPVGLHEWRAPTPALYREPLPGITSLVAEGASVPRAGFLLRWESLGPGTRYSVRVVRPDLSVVAEIDALDREEFEVPADALAGVATGSTLYWRVEAHLPDGSHVTSDMFSVRVE